MSATDSDTRLQAALGEVTTLLERHRVLETWTRNQAIGRQREVVEALVHRQNVGSCTTGCARSIPPTSRTSSKRCPRRTGGSSGSRSRSHRRPASCPSSRAGCAKT